MPHELTEKKKSSFCWSVIFSYSTQQQWSICLLDCDMRWRVDFMTTSDDQFSGWTEKKFQSISQSQAGTEKRSWSLLDCLLPIWSTTAFWMLVKPLYWEVCSANWDAPKAAMPAPGAGQQGGPSSSPQQRPTTSHSQCSKVEWIGLSSFASSAIFTWPLANRLPLLQVISATFCRENSSTTSKRPKILSKSLLNPEAWIFML